MKHFTQEINDRIGTITISRPEALNALTFELAADLADVWQQWERENSVDVIVLKSIGEKAFVAGADIGEISIKNSADMVDEGMQHAIRKIRKSALPSIAVIQGLALGGGFELALACDIRIAASEASFGFPETGLGIIPGAGGTQLLSRYAGVSVANYHALTGLPMSAERAYQLGLVNEIHPVESLTDSAIKLATKIQRKGPVATRLAKRVIAASSDTSFEAGLELELFAQAALFGTSEPKEGLSAFLEKRKPDFHQS